MELASGRKRLWLGVASEGESHVRVSADVIVRAIAGDWASRQSWFVDARFVIRRLRVCGGGCERCPRMMTAASSRGAGRGRGKMKRALGAVVVLKKSYNTYRG